MNKLRYTLLADGTSDRALMPMLNWSLRESGVKPIFRAAWADLTLWPRRPRGLTERIEVALHLHPCDLLFIHRDAEREPREVRRAEITQALERVRSQTVPAAVCVIPVRMHEAWLLFDEAAIRAAAGNSNGRQPLQLPRLTEIERMPDPKERLNQLLKTASGLHGRRLQNWAQVPTWRLADLIDDFSPLRALPAFQAFEEELRGVVDAHGWRDLPA